jgi:pyrroloquinoline-quinone synthase
MDLFDRIEEARTRWNVLDHPFYRRWERGDLSLAELRYYAGQYRHAVLALADAASTASPLAGAEHAAEEREHVALWDAFAAELDVSEAREANAETASCARAWSRASDPLEALAVLYAVESGQPAISRTKLAGLVEHYGFEAESPGAAYFAVHAERDVDHAASARAVLEDCAGEADADRLAGAAAAALRENWRLLDGVTA